MSHLLAIDDSPTVRKLVELSFRGTSWTVDFAARGSDGLQLASRNAPDVILLDFVLPDMRGLDVCAQLANDEETKGIPIVLMSAKDEGVRQLFSPFDSVVDFIPKPFTAEDLSARITAAAAGGARLLSSEPRNVAFTMTEQEAAARVIYGKLARAFSYIPSWCAQMGAQRPAAFFARKILTPDVIASVLDALVPMYREHLGTAVRGDDSTSLSGNARSWPIADVCTLIGASGRTGELRVVENKKCTVIYWRCGEIVFLTSLDPTDHVEYGKLGDVPEDVLAAAKTAQRETGKPLHVTLQERGVLPAALDLSMLLHRVGRRLLVRVLDSREFSFEWRDMAVLPSFVEGHARRIPVTRNTVPFDKTLAPANDDEPPSLRQIALEQMRSAPNADPDAWPKATAVFARAESFHDRIHDVHLDARERRVLSLIDGRHSLEAIASRSGLDVQYVRHIVRCLSSIELVTTNDVARGRSMRPVELANLRHGTRESMRLSRLVNTKGH